LIGVRFPAEARIFIFAIQSRPGLGPTQSPVKMNTEDYMGEKCKTHGEKENVIFCTSKKQFGRLRHRFEDDIKNVT
jgi:hypothetical protein